MRKPHSRSVLKNRPPDWQKSLYEYVREHSLEETEAWLATQGVDAGRSAISDFYHWWPLRAKMLKASGMGEAMKDILRELPSLNLDEQQLSKAGTAIFEAQAIEAEDSELYLALRKLRQNDRSLDLTERSAETKARLKERDLALVERRVKLLEENQRAAKEKLTAVITASKGGLTAETLKAIEEAAGLL